MTCSLVCQPRDMTFAVSKAVQTSQEMISPMPSYMLMMTSLTPKDGSGAPVFTALRGRVARRPWLFTQTRLPKWAIIEVQVLKQCYCAMGLPCHAG